MSNNRDLNLFTVFAVLLNIRIDFFYMFWPIWQRKFMITEWVFFFFFMVQNNRDLLSHRSGGQNSKISIIRPKPKCQQGRTPSSGSRRESMLCLFQSLSESRVLEVGWARKTLTWENQELEWTELGAKLSSSEKESLTHWAHLAVSWACIVPLTRSWGHVVWGQRHEGKNHTCWPRWDWRGSD